LSLRPRSAQAQAEEHAGIVPGRPMGLLSTMAMSMLLRGLDAIITVHGFRSSFRDWAAEAGVEFSVAEQCLARQQRDPLLSANLDAGTQTTCCRVVGVICLRRDRRPRGLLRRTGA
jgi:hypothetical protein